MVGLAGRHILTVGDRTFDWEDLVLCGCLWGEWQALRRRVAEGLACLARLEQLEDDDPDALADEEIEAVAAEFRYARDLVAAEDLERWLARRGLDSDAWIDWVKRTLLLTKWSEDLDAIVEEYAIDPDELETALECEAVCTGLASSLATRLAGRAAIHARLAAERQPGDEIPTGDVEDLLAGVPDVLLDEGLPGLPGPACRARLEDLAKLEGAWRGFTATHATTAAMRSLVETRRLDWIRLSVRLVVVSDRDTASEIALCVREDRRDLAAMCAEVGVPVRETTWYLDEAAEPLRDLLVAARPGDLLGPVPYDDGYLLLAVLSKVWPAESDPDVRQRAERALLDRLAAREIEARVTWHETL